MLKSLIQNDAVHYCSELHLEGIRVLQWQNLAEGLANITDSNYDPYFSHWLGKEETNYWHFQELFNLYYLSCFILILNLLLLVTLKELMTYDKSDDLSLDKYLRAKFTILYFNKIPEVLWQIN